MGGKAYGVGAVKGKGYFPQGLGGVHVERAVGEVPYDFRYFVYGLDDPQLAVHGADRYENRILSDQLPQAGKVDLPVPPDIREIDLIALLLQPGQRSADGGMLQRGGDDMLSDMPRHPGYAFDGKRHNRLQRICI